MSSESTALDTATPEAKPPRRWLVPLLAGVAILAVATAVALTFVLVKASEVSSSDVSEFLGDETPHVEERAREIVDLLLTYDSTNLEQVADRMLELATGNFAEQYEDLVLEGGLADALTEATASSRGQVLDGPDVYFDSASEVIVLARVSQTTQSSENPTGRTIEYVLQLTMVKTEDGGWKADRIDVLSERTAA